jgi:hypothetical protein
MSGLEDGPVANLKIGASVDGAPADPLAFASMGQARVRSAALSIRDFLLIGSALAFVAILGLFYLLQSAQITRLAYAENDRRAELQRVIEANSVLDAEIAVLTRLDRIEARAEELGMEPAQSVMYLRLPGSAAPAVVAAPPAGVGQ